MKSCNHCQVFAATRPRGLCFLCYTTREIRECYAWIECSSNHRGVADYYGSSSLPAEPTDALPGSAEKVAVLEERAARGEALWHPADAPMNAEIKEEA